MVANSSGDEKAVHDWVSTITGLAQAALAVIGAIFIWAEYSDRQSEIRFEALKGLSGSTAEVRASLAHLNKISEDLRYSELKDKNLSGISLPSVKMQNSMFDGAALVDASFIGALSDAGFRCADVTGFEINNTGEGGGPMDFRGARANHDRSAAFSAVMGHVMYTDEAALKALAVAVGHELPGEMKVSLWMKEQMPGAHGSSSLPNCLLFRLMAIYGPQIAGRLCDPKYRLKWDGGACQPQ